MAANSEVAKLRQHLSLLKQEYSKLQSKYRDLESRFAYTISTTANGTKTISAVDSDLSNNFASKLVSTVSSLYESDTYSDITFKLNDQTQVAGHKIVLTSRSNEWNDHYLKDKQELDWSHINVDVAKSIILWLYKSELHLNSENLTLELIKTAFDFKLDALVELCEQHLISIVNLRSCVKFYSVAEDVDAGNLREYCSGLISTYWNDLHSTDFEHMSGPLLYQMLKNKTQLPLHNAVRLQREDVVFLCLVENSNRISDIVNIWSQKHDELPLDLALKNQNASIATTLIQHNADINIRDYNGDSLLHRSIKRCDHFAALFLLENNCDVTLSTRNENDSPLHLIAKYLSLEESTKIAIKLLNKNKISINAQNKHGFTALHLAIENKNNDIFELLLKQPEINLNLKTIEEHPPLYYALEKYEENLSIYVKSLMEIGRNSIETNPIYHHKNNINLLQLLINEGYENAALYLVEFLQDVDHVNADGETALHLACENGCGKLTKVLLKLGANCNLLTNELRQSPLHYAVKGNSSECIQTIIEFNKNLDKMTDGKEEMSDFNKQKKLVNFNIRDLNGDTPISLTVNGNHNELIPILIEGGADINIRNGRDFTLLHQTIMKEDTDTAVFLLQQNGIEINAKTPENETPLQLAIHYRLADVVDALCTKGVDMSAPDRLGNCALWSALDDGNKEEIAKILIRHGADTDCWENGHDGYRQTLLHRAIDENKDSAAIFLIQSGCDLDSPRIPGLNGEGGEEAYDKQTPLHLCSQWGLEDVARTLIEYRANVNAKDANRKTPLHLAIENQHSSIIFTLLSVPEIDLTIRDKNGLSPFAAALTFRNNKAAQAILEKLPSAAEQYDSKGQNFLHVAIKKNDIESALFLLTINVDVNSRVQDALLTPPIHLAAKFGNETLVRSLILAGARVNERDSQKRTALHIASESGNMAAVSALIQNNADYDAVDFANDNSLHIAVREGHLNVVRTLLTESSINAEHINFKGRNPLHELCKYGKENAASISELFLESMPNYPINTPDVNGNSPLLLAYMNGNSNLCRLLVKAKACLGTENCNKISIFNYQVPSKQLLNRLLDNLEQPATWTTTESCQECGKGFSITIRTHHCRHCGRALCSKCSDQEVPIIKFGENRPVRVCQVCFNVLKMGAT